ncbi:isoleucine--tRNA ligase [Bartonella sp. TP]|uniref:isoleucine--tRNA ligase n=1 Tax=Bartonella sp. TP TaxID=3057550 RepID=UPI0025AEECF5|nr:isoleucine--tRNA ligase [Bartonella sp. TP]WJW80356.1 isoleucine--tRNA ligase [Bartonella sp. TP]
MQSSSNFDYSKTLFLPNTSFAMRAALPQKEPEITKLWQEMDLYRRLRTKAKDRPRYVLHDGPPYANGNLHIGHALNKILKDVIVKSKQMAGYNSALVPGWDCHGLPIEWKVEEEYRSEGKKKDDISVNEFRARCRKFAAHWVAVQSVQFQRFGIIGNFANPYLTMDFTTEAIIAEQLLLFAKTKQLYRGSKPVMWSVAEKTALAEAEIEYHEYESDSIWVKFKISNGALAGAYIVIWTTTPWTIPANRAVCYSDNINYGLFEIIEVENDFGPKLGEQLIFADNLAEQCAQKAKLKLQKIRGLEPAEFEEMQLQHPFSQHFAGYDFTVPMLSGEHVTAESGTGFVHTAPSHGRDDFEAWLKNKSLLEQRNIDTTIPFPVDDEGFYTNDVPEFGPMRAGGALRVIDEKGKKGGANAAIIEQLIAAQRLFARARIKHSYPHSWRSKTPLISRNTAQWFIAMDKNLSSGKSLRETAVDALEHVSFTPANAYMRLSSMLKDRPDWVLSRQRTWGVPICIFVNENGEILQDETVNARIIEAFKAEGADAWFSEGARARFLVDRAQEDWVQIMDILDVWFDSGCSHNFVLRQREELSFPADLYFEGSDQHRGWFQASLLESCAINGVAPYKQIVTHGFTIDEKGKKMSKSLGNVVDPQKICDKFGADILRLWVMTGDYCEDQRVGDNIIQMNVDYYRKLRNVIRWMLGTLSHYKGEEVAYESLPELEKYMLHKLAKLDKLIKDAYSEFDFKKIIHSLLDFSIVDLSAFYFDIRKDALYCDAPSSLRRKAALATISKIFDYMILWLAPMLSFTAEEAWQERYKDDSVHLQEFLTPPAHWQNDAMELRWKKVRKVRKVVTGALEQARAEKIIGSSLEAAPEVYLNDDSLQEAIEGLNMADICITSDISILTQALPQSSNCFTLEDVPSVAVKIEKAKGNKCMRSWRYSPEVGQDPEYPDVCARDAAALRELKALNLLDF